MQALLVSGKARARESDQHALRQLPLHVHGTSALDTVRTTSCVMKGAATGVSLAASTSGMWTDRL